MARISTTSTETLATKVAVYGIGFVSSVLIARGLGPADRGRYQLAITIVTAIYYLVNLGTDQAQFRIWSTRPASRPLLFASGRVLGIGLGVAGAAVVAVSLLVSSWSLPAHLREEHLLLVLIALPFMVDGLLLSGLLIVQNKVRRVNIASLIGAALHLSAAFVLYVANLITVPNILVLFLLGVSVPWLLMLVSASAGDKRLVVPRRLIRFQLALGARFAPYTVATYLNLRLDLLMVGAILGASEVGIYGIALIVAELVWLLSDSLMYSVTERLANLDESDSVLLTLQAARISGLLAAAAAIFIALIAPIAIPLVYGSPYAAAARVLPVLAPGIVAMACWRAFNPLIVRTASQSVPAKIALTALAVNLAANLLLLPTIGVIGAGVASSLSYSVGAVLAFAQIRRSFNVSSSAMLPSFDDLRTLGTFFAAIFERVRRTAGRY